MSNSNRSAIEMSFEEDVCSLIESGLNCDYREVLVGGNTKMWGWGHSINLAYFFNCLAPSND